MNKKVNTTLAKIISILSDGQYHDGDSIGKKLQITRSAVWKTIKKLVNYQVKIDSVKGRGYALLEPVVLLEVDKIQSHLQHQGLSIVLFESIESTNEYLRTCRPKKRPVICLAEQQTRGRGRLGREWYSPFGKNIYLSCAYTFNKDISELAGLSMITSLAIHEALNVFAMNKLAVKWPNDIVASEGKIAGSLIDIQAETHGECHVVIGVGINVNMMTDDLHQINQSWTSLRKLTGHYLDRNLICARLIDALMTALAQFETLGFAAFINKWQQADCLTGKVINIVCANEKVSGTVAGISEQGHLLLRLVNGTVRAFSSGDTSIAK